MVKSLIDSAKKCAKDIPCLVAVASLVLTAIGR